MIKKITLCGLLLASVSSFGQTAITITGSDVPAPTGEFNTKQIYPTFKPDFGSNQTWNYSTFVGNNASTVNFYVETDPFFTAAGVDAYIITSKAFNSNFYYDIAYEYDYNTSGVEDKGHYVHKQEYTLGEITGIYTDSIKMVEQVSILSSPRKTMSFPMTANSSWHTVSPRVTDFVLNAPALGLNNTPCQHRYRIFRNDTIVGWGKLSVHTPAGASIPYDVLVDKFEQYAVDSFFVAGSPVSTQLKTTFSVSQGQITDKQYGYHFYRKGSPYYLLRLNYGADKTYTTLSGAYINTDNITTAGIGELKDVAYQSITFPNPANGNEISVRLIGKIVINPTYTILDISGKTIAEGCAISVSNDFIQVPLTNTISNGNYILKIKDSANKDVVLEHISVNR